ncbi:peptidoglycan DD-metalloendopeptidase family protein [Streptomyces scopuliridis]|uniref:peptidoglycan DD-metalloendopeptidase family protein n=1 Tax=Streptomyces scopuliridis TaxID=452529 RepID=UPI0034428760
MTTPAVVGTAAVDVVPIIPNFHTRLRALVLPIADRVGRDAGERMGDAISRNIVISIPDAIVRGGRAGVRAAGRQGDDAGGAFSRSLRRKLEAAFKAMPKLDVRLSDTGVDAELARLRARMETLSNKRIGIDVDARAAEAEVKRIDAELKRLGAQHPNIAVRADTATARAALAELRAEIAAVDAHDPRIKVDVDTSGATSALLGLAVQMGVLTAIPLGPVLAAGLGAVVSMAAAATAGVGALALAAIPAIKGVADAVSLKSAAEDEANRTTSAGNAASVQATQRALSQASAQQTLAAAHRNAASSIASANRQIEQAQRAVADASERAAEQRRTAAENVRRAEQSLTDANRSARDAEISLTQARADAAAQLRALNGQLEDGALSQREAALRVKEAEQELQKVMADGKSTDLQRESAQLAYDRAVQGAKRQAESYNELKTSAEAQRKAGVEGSDAVRAAQERVGQANRSVADQQRALAQAQAGVVKAQRDGARAVADAQERVAEAVRRAAEAQVSAAQSITSAQRGVESARLSASKTTAAAITKEDEYRAALAKMTPEARDLFDAFAGPRGLRSAFSEWSKSLEPTVLPIFTRGVDGAKASLPGLTPLVEGAARGITRLMDSASAELKSPFWQSFKSDMAESVEPAIVGLGTALGNVLKGMAGVIDAFLPKMDGIASRSDRITERFAKWGTSLKGSPGFEKFLQYVKDTSPGLAKFIGEILTSLLDVSKALAPMSSTMFELLGPVFEAVSWMATNFPEVIQMLWAFLAVQKAIQLGMAAFAIAMGIYNAVMIIAAISTGGFAAVLSATGILPIIRAVLIVVGLLAAGIVLAYQKCDWFRAAVDGAWGAIKVASSFLWNNILKPMLSGIWKGLTAVGDAAVWLWDKALKPAFSFIGKAAQILFTILAVAVLAPIYLAFKALGAVGKWLWEKVLSPVFGWIGDKAKWLYEKAIKPAMSWAGDRFRDVGTVLKWVWDHVIAKVFNWIGDKASWLYNKAIKPPFDNIKKAMGKVSDAFALGRDAIKKAWDKIGEITKKPVKFVIDHVYNAAIVPLWNKVAAITGADKLKKLAIDGYHTGGIMSGYSPGRDDRVIAVGGGEAVMRPEWTRAVGADRINAWNAAARSGGIGGVQRAISAGMPAFKDGGIVGWLKDKGNAVGDFFSGAVDFLDPTKVFSKATGFIKDQLKSVTTNPWSKEIAKLPVKILSGMKDAALNLIGFGGGDGGGQWMKPVNAAYGTPFGKKGSMWSSGRHTGLDFPATVGAAVKAVDAGRVALAQGGGPYGNHILINHGKGLASMYAHLSQIATKVGASVSRGQRVGAVGATGNVTGPHLHLEARRNGVAIDPMQFLSGGSTSYKPSAGVAQWSGVVRQALDQVGQPQSLVGTTLRRMAQESGGNPNAVNRNDINWINGTPSVGLMQVIKPTFEAYAGKYRATGPKTYGVSTNPMANIYSSMRYALSRYGSLSKAYNRIGGYAAGGFPSLGETAWVGENGPELVRFLHPAQVYSNADSMSLARTQARARDIYASTSREAPQIHADVRVYVGDRELTDIVDTRIDVYDRDVADGLTTGRRYI